MTSLRFVFCLLISIPAYTYSSGSIDGRTGGDVSKGQLKSAACQGCHGPDGNSFSPDWPSLAGQNANYLSGQIRDFQSGARQDPTMQSMVTGLTEQDIADIAAYFGAQKVKTDAASNSAVGKKLYMGGNRYTHLPACAGCHGPNGAGNGPGAIPGLAGQKPGYVIKTMQDFKTGARSNDRNQIMQDIAAKMTEKEIEAVAQFLVGMGARAPGVDE
ncbi:MAG: cytochrome c4 [Gammaproteobacteria bacterium]|nr:cytochrome c4 [Gammaproteobacteria bacterium]